MNEPHPPSRKLSSPFLYWKTLAGALVISFVVGLGLQILVTRFGPADGPYPRGSQVPPFSLTSIEGGEPQPFLDLAKGSSVVVINFWATWCAPCITEMPSLVALHNRFKDRGLKMIFVSVDDDAPNVVPLALTRFQIDFPTYFDEGQNLTDLFAVTGLPKSYVLDATGKVLDVVVGDRDWVSEESLTQFEAWLK